MRTLIVALVVMASLAGCSEAEPEAPEDPNPEPVDSDADGFTDEKEMEFGTDPMDPESHPTPPEPMQFTGSLKGIGDVSSQAPCAAGEQQCESFPVPIPTGRWRVTFTLTPIDGTVTGNGQPYRSDYELVVLGQSSTNAPGEKEIISGVIEGPKDEMVEIQAWHDIDGSYQLDVTFAYP